MRTPHATGLAISFLTIREVAERLKVSQRTIRRWIDRGYLQAVKLGRTVRIDERALSDRIVSTSRTARPRSRAVEIDSFSALADDAFARTWNNREDAVYDRWREIYGIRKGRRRAGRLSVSR